MSDGTAQWAADAGPNTIHMCDLHRCCSLHRILYIASGSWDTCMMYMEIRSYTRIRVASQGSPASTRRPLTRATKKHTKCNSPLVGSHSQGYS